MLIFPSNSALRNLCSSNPANCYVLVEVCANVTVEEIGDQQQVPSRFVSKRYIQSSYNDITIAILVIVHSHVFYLKHDVSWTGTSYFYWAHLNRFHLKMRHNPIN
jgi:hypothetical protein